MKKVLRLVGFGFILCVFAILGLQADIIYLKNGEEYKGNLKKMDKNSVSFRVDETGLTEDFARSEVVRIELSKKRSGDDVSHLEDLKDDVLHTFVRLNPTAEDYPDAGYVTLYEEVNIIINPDYSCTETRRIIRKILQERSINEAANHILTYLSKDETLKIDFARTIDPEGNLFHIRDNAVEYGSVYSEIPEYENLRQLKFALPEVKLGTVIDYQITYTKKRISTLTPYLIKEYFRNREPLLKKAVRITIPRDLKLDSKVVRPNDNITSTTAYDFPKQKYDLHWTVIDAPLMERPEYNMPAFSDVVPVLTAGLHREMGKIGQEYFKVLEENFRPGKGLKTRVQELTEDLETPKARALALYNYVTKKIRYISVAPAEYSYSPKPLDVIFESKLGNGLDKTYLLYGMLKLAGLNPSFLWLRAQSAGALVKEVSSLGQFTTPLVVMEINGQPKYLDPCLDTVPFNTLLADYQGVYGLLIKTDTCRLIKTPLYEPEQESLQSNFEISLQADGSIQVKKAITLAGSYEIGLRQYKDLKPEELEKEFQTMVNQIHPNARLIDYRISDLKDLDEKVSINLTYEIKDYAIRAGESLLAFKLPEINYSAYEVGKASRDYALDWDARCLESNKIKITIPEGYRVYYLPENYSFKESGVLSYRAQFKTGEARQITFDDTYARQTISLPIDRYALYKECLETKAALAKEWIVLEKE